MRTLYKKAAVVIMAVAMMVAFMPALPFLESAYGGIVPVSTNITVGGVSLASGQYALTDDQGNVTTSGAAESNYNVYYHKDAEGNYVLELRNANIKGVYDRTNDPYGAGIYFSHDDLDLTITLTGTNSVTGASGGLGSAAIFNGNSDFYATTIQYSSDLTINGTGSLTSSASNMTGAYDCGIFSIGALNIGGSAKVTGIGGDLTSGVIVMAFSLGLCSYTGDINISGAADVSGIAGTAVSDGECKSIGMWGNGNIAVTDSAKVTCVGKQTTGSKTDTVGRASFGIYSDGSIGTGKLASLNCYSMATDNAFGLGTEGGTVNALGRSFVTRGNTGAMLTYLVNGSSYNKTISRLQLPTGYMAFTTTDYTGSAARTKYTSGGNVPDSARFLVICPCASGISLNKTSLNMAAGSTYRLVATLTPGEAVYQGVAWHSSNTAVAKIAADGTITAVKPGTATITCKVEDETGAAVNCTVNVQAAAGKTYTAGKFRYRVVNASTDGTGTVMVTGGISRSAAYVTIGNTVRIGNKSYKITYIAAGAFKKYKNLRSVTIGKNVRNIYSNTFYGDKKLKTITIRSKVLSKVGKNAIKGIYKKAVIKVPRTKYKTYKKLLRNSTGYVKTMKIKKY